ncbi:MAG: hypothetical protein OEV44_01120 [Spirochaetota bacterium]|nr:hypothetical protein [Spirochaetota bacterium]
MKQITLDDTKQRLKAGIDKLANIVKVTMGGAGKNVIIRDASFGYVSIINDGINIAKEVELDDVVENTGAMLAKLAAHKTNEEAGDGTTSTIVLLQAYLNEMMKIKTKDQRGLREEIKGKIDFIVNTIDQQKKEAEGRDLYKVALNSALDEEIAEVVVEVVEKIGKDGVFNIFESSTTGIQTEVIDGIKLDDGFITPYFINNQDNGKAEFSNVPVLLLDKPVNTIHQLLTLMDGMLKAGENSMVIFANRISDDVTNFLLTNKAQGKFQSCVVKTDNFDELELITGARAGSDFTPESLGRAGSIIISGKETIVSADESQREAIGLKIEALKSQLKENPDLKDKISRLENGIATLRIGGHNMQEAKERKYKLEDAMNAVMSAIDDGIVEGGGMTLYRISETIKDRSQSSKLIKEVLKAPLKQIIENGEDNFSEVIKGYKDDKGYNVVKREWEDLFVSGVIDPAKVVKSSLSNAFSYGNQILTVEAGIIEENHKDLTK